MDNKPWIIEFPTGLGLSKIHKLILILTEKKNGKQQPISTSPIWDFELQQVIS